MRPLRSVRSGGHSTPALPHPPVAIRHHSRCPAARDRAPHLNRVPVRPLHVKPPLPCANDFARHPGQLGTRAGRKNHRLLCPHALIQALSHAVILLDISPKHTLDEDHHRLALCHDQPTGRLATTISTAHLRGRASRRNTVSDLRGRPNGYRRSRDPICESTSDIS